MENYGLESFDNELADLDAKRTSNPVTIALESHLDNIRRNGMSAKIYREVEQQAPGTFNQIDPYNLTIFPSDRQKTVAVESIVGTITMGLGGLTLAVIVLRVIVSAIRWLVSKFGKNNKAAVDSSRARAEELNKSIIDALKTENIFTKTSNTASAAFVATLATDLTENTVEAKQQVLKEKIKNVAKEEPELAKIVKNITPKADKNIPIKVLDNCIEKWNPWYMLAVRCYQESLSAPGKVTIIPNNIKKEDAIAFSAACRSGIPKSDVENTVMKAFRGRAKDITGDVDDYARLFEKMPTSPDRVSNFESSLESLNVSVLKFMIKYFGSGDVKFTIDRDTSELSMDTSNWDAYYETVKMNYTREEWMPMHEAIDAGVGYQTIVSRWNEAANPWGRATTGEEMHKALDLIEKDAISVNGPQLTALADKLNEMSNNSNGVKISATVLNRTKDIIKALVRMTAMDAKVLDIRKRQADMIIRLQTINADILARRAN